MHEEDLLVRRKRLVYITRALIATAVASLAVFGSLGFYGLISDNHRVRGENRDLRDQVESQGEESECRAAAAAAQADAQGDLAVATAEAAEFAFQLSLDQVPSTDPAVIAAHLKAAKAAVAATTRARNESIESCNIAEIIRIAAGGEVPVGPCVGSGFVHCNDLS